jgi:hypothetical protein
MDRFERMLRIAHRRCPTATWLRAFPDVVRAGDKSTRELTGIGGTHTAESVRLPSITFTIGDHVATLRPAEIVLENSPGWGLTAVSGMLAAML